MREGPASQMAFKRVAWVADICTDLLPLLQAGAYIAGERTFR